MEEAWPVHDYLSKTIWETGGSLHKLDSNVKKLFSQRIDSWNRCGPVHDYLSKTIWETGGGLRKLDSNVKKLFSQRIDSRKRCGLCMTISPRQYGKLEEA